MLKKCCTNCNTVEKYCAKGLCSRCYRKAYRAKNLEKHRERERINIRKYRATEAYREYMRKYLREYASKHRKTETYRKLRREYRKNYRLKNLEKCLNRERAIRAKDPERFRLACKRNYHRNRKQYIAKAKERYALIRGPACPKWLTKEQKKEMADFYANRPEGYHVDHIVPLRGRNVSGLHVPWNLQYLPAKENLAKGNRGY